MWNGPPRRVLVLDDDDLIVRAVGRLLRSVGLTVEGTTDANEALAIARRSAPDVVVSDLHMPNACGASFLTSVAEIAPGAMRVLMSADPDFLPKVGSIAEARLHALMSKSELTDLGVILVQQLRGRLELPVSGDDREALARGIAHALCRPPYEDDAHRERVTRWTGCVAATMGLPEEEVDGARLGAILHDVGQVTLRDRLFTKGAGLSPSEREEVARHPDAGARIVEEMPALRDALEVIASHHERQDGAGYPARLGGSAIPRAARAFQVVNAYDAMTHGRPYRARRSHREALDELTRNAGRVHDAEAVRALDSIGEEGLHAALAG